MCIGELFDFCNLVVQVAEVHSSFVRCVAMTNDDVIILKSFLEMEIPPAIDNSDLFETKDTLKKGNRSFFLFWEIFIDLFPGNC